MKKIFIIPITFLMTALSNGLDWSGYLSTDTRFSIKTNYPVSFEEYRLSLIPEGTILERLKFHSEIWFRTFGFADLLNLRDLNDRGKITNGDWELREVYLDIYGFPLKNIDLCIGRQRIAWGTADRINPTDNLNPRDLEDIWDFGRHLASNGIRIDYYIKELSISGVFIPQFTPAILPHYTTNFLGLYEISMPPGVVPESVYNTIITPHHHIKNSIAGLKLKKNILGFDFSFSYVYGRDDIPILKKTTLIPKNLPIVDISNKLIFPKMQIIGADFAGALGDLGIWAEGALFLPESVNLNIDMSQIGMGTIDTLILNGRLYLKYTVGIDYTFKNGIYLNLQYAHGFFHERGVSLEDYLLMGIEWKFLRERLKFMPLGGGVEVKEFSDIKNNYAFVYAPEISYKPAENCEISFGLKLIDGKPSTTFGKMKDNDEVAFKIKYSF